MFVSVRLNAQQWKGVDGIYQAPNDKDRYVQFSSREGMLVAKLLWNNAEIHFLPDSGLAFTSKEAEGDGPIHLVFHKDPAGIADQVDIGKLGIWKRANDYKPIGRKEMPHTPEQLKPFVGLYRLQNVESRFIQFTVRGNQLILKQTWDGNEIFFLPESELSFYSPVIPAFLLDFTKGTDGTITQVLAFKHDLWIRAPKISMTAAALKMFEGKYQSKDDPDNQIQIRAGDNSLIIKQLWDGKEIVVQPWTETYFYNDVLSYPLQVIKEKDGSFKGVQLLDSNMFQRLPG